MRRKASLGMLRMKVKKRVYKPKGFLGFVCLYPKPNFIFLLSACSLLLQFGQAFFSWHEFLWSTFSETHGMLSRRLFWLEDFTGHVEIPYLRVAAQSLPQRRRFSFLCPPSQPWGCLKKGCVMLPFMLMQRQLASACFPSGYTKPYIHS